MAPISFARGAPAPECIDSVLIADCARAALERDGTTILSYGAGGGYAPLRELLADRHGVAPGRVFLTIGGLHGFFHYAAVQLKRRPGRVLVEAPTYDRPLKLLGWQGVEVAALPMDEEGLELEALEAELDGYPGGVTQMPVVHDEGSAIVHPLRVRVGDAVLSLISTITLFGTPLDVTLSELAIESFFPADEETRFALQRMAAGRA